MSNAWIFVLSLAASGCSLYEDKGTSSLCLGEVFTQSGEFVLGGDVLYTLAWVGDQGRRQLNRHAHGGTSPVDSGSALRLIDADDASVLYVKDEDNTTQMIRRYRNGSSIVVAEEKLPSGAASQPYLTETLVAWRSAGSVFVFDGDVLHTLGNGQTARIATAGDRVVWSQPESGQNVILEWKAGTTREITRLSEEISSLSVTGDTVYIAFDDEVLAHRDSSGLRSIFKRDCEAPSVIASNDRVAINCAYGQALYSTTGNGVQELDSIPADLTGARIESVRITGSRIVWSRGVWDGQEIHSTGKIGVSASQGEQEIIARTGSRCMVCAFVGRDRSVDVSAGWIAWNYSTLETESNDGEDVAYAALAQCND